jgi:hypothetical protein
MSDDEAQRIYYTLFRREIPPVVAERFAQASARLEASLPPGDVAAYHRAVASGADLEALELAARYTRKLPLLTRKLGLMAYLAETQPENQPLFINERSSYIAGFVRLGVAALHTVWKMVKGLWLLRQVRHA